MHDPRLQEFEQILRLSPVGAVLPEIEKLALPDCWLAAGAVRNTIWRARLGESCALSINDYDVAFFDLTGGREQEVAAQDRLSALFPTHTFDVVNQASFCRWRTALTQKVAADNTEQGLAGWLHTATTVGVRLRQGQYEWLAPYGFDDLWNGIVRPTPEHVHNPAAAAKAAGFLAKCPSLRMG